jgi:hypothetical protein
VTSIAEEEFDKLLSSFGRETIHLETRDAYGTAVELPHMAKWAAGVPDDLAWLQPWCATLRGHIRAGRKVRRARIVSEPLSDYQRWSYNIASSMVEAGEDIRWVPRRLVSSIAVPGNDFYVFDDRLVVFLHYAATAWPSTRSRRPIPPTSSCVVRRLRRCGSWPFPTVTTSPCSREQHRRVRRDHGCGARCQ